MHPMEDLVCETTDTHRLKHFILLNKHMLHKIHTQHKLHTQHKFLAKAPAIQQQSIALT